MQGEVIGIASHNISRSGGFEGLGFLVTSNMARRLLLEQKSFWSGISGVILEGCSTPRSVNIRSG
jgi:serine protease Do